MLMWLNNEYHHVSYQLREFGGNKPRPKKSSRGPPFTYLATDGNRLVGLPAHQRHSARLNVAGSATCGDWVAILRTQILIDSQSVQDEYIVHATILPR